MGGSTFTFGLRVCRFLVFQPLENRAQNSENSDVRCARCPSRQGKAMTRFNLSLCFRLLPATAVAVSSTVGRGVQRSTYHHRRSTAVAFGWTCRGGHSSGDSSTTGNTASRSLHSAAKSIPGSQLQGLVDAAPSLMATVVAVASDVDGTLTTPDVTVTMRTKEAIKAVMESELVFFPATGKVREGETKCTI